MTNNMGVKEGCNGDDGGSAMVKRGVFSTMASPLPKKRITKQMVSSLVKVNCRYHLQASYLQNRLRAWIHRNWCQ